MKKKKANFLARNFGLVKPSYFLNRMTMYEQEKLVLAKSVFIFLVVSNLVHFNETCYCSPFDVSFLTLLSLLLDFVLMLTSWFIINWGRWSLSQSFSLLLKIIKLHVFLFKNYFLAHKALIVWLKIFHFMKIILFSYFMLKTFYLLERSWVATKVYVCG